jgi:hypothetical protein
MREARAVWTSPHSWTAPLCRGDPSEKSETDQTFAVQLSRARARSRNCAHVATGTSYLGRGRVGMIVIAIIEVGGVPQRRWALPKRP